MPKTLRSFRSLPRRGMRRRWWLFRPGDWIARFLPVLKPKRGLMIVRLDGIGDMVLFRPALDSYAEAFGVSRSDITIIGCKSWAGLTDIAFAGYRVIAIDEHAFERRAWYRLRIALLVRWQNPKTTVCDMFFRKAIAADSLVWLSGAAQTIVSKPYVSEATEAEFEYYLARFTRVIDTGAYPVHETIRHFRFISAISGQSITPVTPSIVWRDKAPPAREGRPYVVLNFGSNEYGRRWPFASYLDIAERLLDHGFRVAFVGAAGESDVHAQLRYRLNRPGVIDLVGRTSLPELLDLLCHAAAMISNDTGPAHLGIAVGTPTLIIVGGGHYGSFVPYPESIRPPNARFINYEMDCYHCYWRCHKRATKFDVFPCVANVPTEGVWQEVSDMLDLPAGQAAE